MLCAHANANCLTENPPLGYREALADAGPERERVLQGPIRRLQIRGLGTRYLDFLPSKMALSSGSGGRKNR